MRQDFPVEARIVDKKTILLLAWLYAVGWDYQKEGEPASTDTRRDRGEKATVSPLVLGEYSRGGG